MKKQQWLVALVIMALSLALVACGALSISTDDGVLTVNVKLNEDQVNGIIARVFTDDVNDEFLFKQLDSIDLIEPDVIRVFGTTADGVSGSYDMTVAAENEALKFEVVAVDIPGVTMDDPRIQSANDELAQAFLDTAAESNSGGGIAEAAVVDDELVLTITAALE